MVVAILLTPLHVLSQLLERQQEGLEALTAVEPLQFYEPVFRLGLPDESSAETGCVDG